MTNHDRTEGADASRAPGSVGRPLDDADTLRELVRWLREGIYVADERGALLDATPAFLEMVGVSAIEELSGRTVDDLVADPGRRRAALAGLAEGHAAREVEVHLVRTDGERRLALDTVYARRDPRTGALRQYGIMTDVTAERGLEAKLREAATRDALTGCYDRRHLDVLQRELGTLAGTGALVVEIDGLADYTRRHGRQAADDVLQRMGRFLMRHVRAGEPVVRLTESQFLVVLMGANGPRTERAARRIQLTALRAAPASFCLGWAVHEGSESLDELIGRALGRTVPVRVVERTPDDRRRGSDRSDAFRVERATTGAAAE